MADSKTTETSNVASIKESQSVASTQQSQPTKPTPAHVASQPTRPARIVNSAYGPTAVHAATINTSKGGDKTVAETVKDPKGMFDYTGCPTYVVKDGDTLYSIAQKYTVALEQLRYFNHLNKLTWQIRTGQTLYIPTKPVHVPTGK